MREEASRRHPVLVLLLALAAGACGTSDDAGPRERSEGEPIGSLVDADGRAVSLSPTASRIVSLVPSATLTLAAIGAGDALVARTDYDTATWALGLPSVGGGLNPSLETIAAATPDLVIRFGGPQDTRTPTALDGLGIRHLAIRPDGIADILRIVEQLGALTGRTTEAAATAAGIRSGLDSVRAEAPPGPPLRVAYVLGGTPPWVAGPGTYVQELLEVVGATNAFADLGSLYAAVGVEEFMAREVDLILTPEPGRLDARLRGRSRVVAVGGTLELPGPGVVQAARALAGLLAPGGAP